MDIVDAVEGAALEAGGVLERCEAVGKGNTTWSLGCSEGVDAFSGVWGVFGGCDGNFDVPPFGVTTPSSKCSSSSSTDGSRGNVLEW